MFSRYLHPKVDLLLLCAAAVLTRCGERCVLKVQRTVLPYKFIYLFGKQLPHLKRNLRNSATEGKLARATAAFLPQNKFLTINVSL